MHSASRPFTVRFIYDNAVTLDFDCAAITVEKNTVSGEITKLEWEDAMPRPLYTGLDNLIAVWTLEDRTNEPKYDANV